MSTVEVAETRELKERVIEINRVAKVVKGGRRFSFTALVVVGDEVDRVGVGYGKAREVPLAISKAVDDAKKNLFTVPKHGMTITHEILGEYDAARVFMRPASEGTGVIAGAGVRAVLELAGIRDVLAKSLGTTNPINMTRATVDGLRRLRRPEEVAALRGKTVADVLPYRPPAEEPAEEPAPAGAATETGSTAGATPEATVAPASAGDVADLGWVPESARGALVAAGVTAGGQFLAAGATPANRRELAQTIGVEESELLTWLNRADLMRITGVGPEYATLLEAAGVDTVPELAQRNPENLAAALAEHNAAEKLTKRTPSAGQVAGWVEQAGSLDRVLHYD